MIDDKKKKEAKQNFDKYLQDGLIKKEKNETARAMYIKNAELSLHLGYKTSSKVVHKVTSDALIVLVMDKIRKGLLEEYEDVKEDALEIASIKSEEVIAFYSLEMDKRSRFQYDMTETIQEQKAKTSLKRAKEFTLGKGMFFWSEFWGLVVNMTDKIEVIIRKILSLKELPTQSDCLLL